MLARSLRLGLVVLPILAVACGDTVRKSGGSSDDDDGSGGTGGVGGGAGDGGGPDVPPIGQPPPPGPTHPGDGAGVVLAVSKLLLGDTDWDGMKSAAAWKKFGMNIDGLVSDASSSGLCKPRAGGKGLNVYPDGDNGIDNSWGKNILPIVTGVSPDASTQTNDGIQSGNFTFLFHLTDLGASADYNPIAAREYGGAALGFAPSFDGTDAWPVSYESLVAPPELGSAHTQFPASYVVGNVWVSGATASALDIALGDGGFTAAMRVHRPLVTIELAADHQSSSHGVISGIIDIEEYIAEFKKYAGQFSPDLCEGSTIESISNQLRQAADIMIDGSQNPAVECDGLSIGLGFEARAVQLGPVAQPERPPPDPCANP